MQTEGIVQFSIPFFFGLIALEVLVSLALRRKLYRFNDSMSDIALGSIQQMTGLLLQGVLVFVYAMTYKYLSIQSLFGVDEIPQNNPFYWSDTSPVGFGVDWLQFMWWALAFLLIDKAYYWFHRYAHEVAVMWAAHVVHHSSEEYNLTTALRQSALQTLTSFPFFAVLAVIGIQWQMFTICYGINLLYQFWIHTRVVKRLGFLELFMNTPSHHRVHHGKNPKYCDKNHAGVFIIWDRMFGTFVKEDEEPVYGITVPLNSWNPIWANIHTYAYLFKDVARARGLDKLRILFNKPGWRPAYLGPSILPKEVDRKTYQVYDPKVPTPVTIFVVVQFLVTLLASTQVLEFANSPKSHWYEVAVMVFFLTLSMTNLGGLMDGKRWAFFSEMARTITVGLACGVFALLLNLSIALRPDYVVANETGNPQLPVYLMVGLVGFHLVSAIWLGMLYKYFRNGDAVLKPSGQSPTAQAA